MSDRTLPKDFLADVEHHLRSTLPADWHYTRDPIGIAIQQALVLAITEDGWRVVKE